MIVHRKRVGNKSRVLCGKVFGKKPRPRGLWTENDSEVTCIKCKAMLVEAALRSPRTIKFYGEWLEVGDKVNVKGLGAGHERA